MTKFQRICLAFIVIVWFILVAAFSMKMGEKKGYKSGYADALSSIKPDTVWRDTTIYKEKPVPEYHYIDTGKTILVPVRDTINTHDTTYISLPTEIKGYMDEDYELQISGILPNLDWIKVHQKTAYITVPVPEYKYPTFSLSPTLGGFIFPQDYGVGAGLELDYWLNRWEISGGGGYYISNNSKGVYGEVKVKYNLIRK